MNFAVKLILANVLIVTCTLVAKRRPELAGLLTVMPTLSLIVLLWLYCDVQGDAAVMSRFALSAAWGIVPSILFFVAACGCFCRGWSLGMTLTLSFAIWSVAAVIQHYLVANR
jgi:uncharacterized membrane protein (GlpM family)